MLLLRTERVPEAVELLGHAYAIFCKQVPNHPLKAMLEEMFGREANAGD